jgi:hypothetical protein
VEGSVSRLEQVRAMPPEAMIPAAVAQDAVSEALSQRLSVAVERELTLLMYRKLVTANLLVGQPRADDDEPLDDTWLETSDPGRIPSAVER